MPTTHCQFDDLGTCTNNPYRDKLGANAKKLGPIYTKLNVIDRYLFALQYARDADPIGAQKKLDWYGHPVRPPTLVDPPPCLVVLLALTAFFIALTAW